MRLTKVFALLVTGSVGMIALTMGCGDGGGSTGTAGAGGTGTAGTGGTAGMGGAGTGACAPSCEANKGVTSDCIAITDNKGKGTYGLRMGQLSINKPMA